MFQCKIGVDYPQPIVNHSEKAAHNIELIQENVWQIRIFFIFFLISEHSGKLPRTSTDLLLTSSRNVCEKIAFREYGKI